MSAIINNSFRKFQADNFIEGFTETVGSPAVAKNNIYLAIGKTDVWSGTTADNVSEFKVTSGNTASDTDIPVPVDTGQAHYLHWNDIRSAKRIQDVSHVIARYDWTSGTVYREYDHERDDIIDNKNPANNVTESPFYVFTEDFRVYKCISNGGGAESISKPTGNSPGLIKTPADGYVWKFMYEVQQADVLKFVTTDWIPAKTLTADDGTSQWDVQTAAIDGSIDYIKITNGGNGYRSTTGVPRAGSIASNLLLQDAAGGNTTEVAQNTPDFYNDMTVYITDGQGAGQFRTITDYDGDSRTVTGLSADWDANNIPNTTSVYQIMPAVTLTGIGGGQGGAGSGITARVSSVVAGAIKEITIVDKTPISSYREATATITSGSGAGAILKVIINPAGGHGKNAVAELGGAFVMMNVRLRGLEGSSLFVNEDFRKVHVILNPQVSAGAKPVATADTYKGEDLLEDSGTILYTEFRPPIHRSSDSTEDIKLVVEF